MNLKVYHCTQMSTVSNARYLTHGILHFFLSLTVLFFICSFIIRYHNEKKITKVVVTEGPSSSFCLFHRNFLFLVLPFNSLPVPCGHCRQFIAELEDFESIELVIEGRAPTTMLAYLPDPFRPSSLHIDEKLVTPLRSSAPGLSYSTYILIAFTLDNGYFVFSPSWIQ